MSTRTGILRPEESCSETSSESIAILPGPLPSQSHTTAVTLPHPSLWQRAKTSACSDGGRLLASATISLTILIGAFVGLFTNYGDCPCDDYRSWFVTIIFTVTAWWVPSPLKLNK